MSDTCPNHIPIEAWIEEAKRIKQELIEYKALVEVSNRLSVMSRNERDEARAQLTEANDAIRMADSFITEIYEEYQSPLCDITGWDDHPAVNRAKEAGHE